MQKLSHRIRTKNIIFELFSETLFLWFLAIAETLSSTLKKTVCQKIVSSLRFSRHNLTCKSIISVTANRMILLQNAYTLRSEVLNTLWLQDLIWRKTIALEEKYWFSINFRELHTWGMSSTFKEDQEKPWHEMSPNFTLGDRGVDCCFSVHRKCLQIKSIAFV